MKKLIFNCSREKKLCIFLFLTDAETCVNHLINKPSFDVNLVLCTVDH